MEGVPPGQLVMGGAAILCGIQRPSDEARHVCGIGRARRTDFAVDDDL
jgi:hypothetical protein